MGVDEQNLRASIEQEFGLNLSMLTEFHVGTFNDHFLAHGKDGLVYHVTVRDFSKHFDTPEVIEKVLELEAKLEGPTTFLISTAIRTRKDRYLMPADSYCVSVRSHLGEACTTRDSFKRIVSAAIAHGQSIDKLGRVPIRVKSKNLRFMNVEDTLKSIEERLKTFVSTYADAETLQVLWDATEVLKEYDILGFRTKPRLVHGDLSVSNMIKVDDNINVVDHDCLHYDHPLYDLSHLLLDVSCTAYFSGYLKAETAFEFSRILINESNYKTSKFDLFAVAIYVLLKKLALVRQPINLRLIERKNIIRDLRKILEKGGRP